jgi:hypothetical protein
MMKKMWSALVIAGLVATAAPALAGNQRSCAATGATSEIGFVAMIIELSGAAWWANMWAGARPC